MEFFHVYGDFPRKRRFSTSCKSIFDNFLTAITKVLLLAKRLSTSLYTLLHQDPTIILKNSRLQDFNTRKYMFRSLFNKVASFQLPRLWKMRLWQLFSYEFSEKQVRKCHLFKLLKK